MSPSQAFALRFLLPATLGGLIALAVLLFAPEWVYPDHKSTSFGWLEHPASSELNERTADELEQSADTLANDQWHGPVSYSNAVNTAAPSVVNIYTRKLVQRKTHPMLNNPYFERFFENSPEPRERMQSSLGSGVILTADGHIITNYHVIAGADEIVVSLHDGRDANASVVGSDPESDLAVLKIELAPVTPIKNQQQATAVGDVVLAIGNPFGVGQTVTMGIVSATGRNKVGLNTYENYIQTDAAINPGNSGGALINAHGELVGINTAIFSQSGGSEGISFAIPADNAIRAMNDISTYGTTIRGWLGIEVQEATPELLKSLRLPTALTGLLVTGIVPNGPAQQSGLSVGDILVRINNEDASNARDAMNRIAELRPGDAISVDYLRKGEIHSTRATAGLREQN
jgi:serine protease DegS